MQPVAQRRALGPAPPQLACAGAAAHALWPTALRLHPLASHGGDRPHTGTLVQEECHNRLGLCIRLFRPLT
jgi:hypothetical protein